MSQAAVKRPAPAGDTRGAKRARVEDQQPVTRVLLVSGFPMGTESQPLRLYFETQGAVDKVDIHDTAGKAPFALVHMQYPHHAERAKRELAGNLWRGSALKVDYAFEDQPENNPVQQTRVHVALDPSAPGNHRLTVGQLFLMLAPIMDEPDKKHGAFVDPHGHVVIPVTAFPTDDDDEEEEA
eukprot:Rhum_TRINITY_DN23124_c0_g1::Rhum_TRINITY_DN23124_c0_g1_i1::g.177215::m.177215